MKAEQVQSRLRAANSLLCAWARKQSAARKHPAALSVSAVRSSLTTSPWTCAREVRTRNSKSGGSKPKPACLKLTCSKPTARIPGSATSYGCCKTAFGWERLGERSEDGVPARRQTWLSRFRARAYAANVRQPSQKSWNKTHELRFNRWA